jgi:peptide/nickel transport system permease protein
MKAESIIRKYPDAFVSGLFLCMFVIVSLIGPYLVPDLSTSASTQFPEIGVQGAGFRCYVINWNDKKESPVPVERYEWRGDSLYASLYFRNSLTNMEFTGFRGEIQDIRQKHYYLGSDQSGRDILSRLVLGARISIFIGFTSVLISVVIGVLLGSAAGYSGGFTDKLISWLIQVFWSVPSVLLAIALTLGLGKGITALVASIGLSMWTDTARMVRGQFITLKKRQFIEACKALGYNPIRVILLHMLPNCSGVIIVTAVSNFATAILLEAGLSFLGQGIQPPSPSWGGMIEDNKALLFGNHVLQALLPGICILLIVLAFTLLGNGLRERLANSKNR